MRDIKFRKKPVVVEAMQLKWETWGEMCEFAGVGKLSNGCAEGCYVDKEGHATDSPTLELGLQIPTLEGLHLGRENDWIIRGVKGELSPCKPDIFELTYEEEKY